MKASKNLKTSKIQGGTDFSRGNILSSFWTEPCGVSDVRLTQHEFIPAIDGQPLVLSWLESGRVQSIEMGEYLERSGQNTFFYLKKGVKSTQNSMHGPMHTLSCNADSMSVPSFAYSKVTPT